ncbi:MAG TPA: host attachment protein [Rhodanobacteraceae bacterium]|nr:host attachment protein [Rhodanobacteraceae bacterium]
MTGTNTWILVADGTRARLFEAASPDDALNELACFANPGGRAHGRDVTTAGPPTVNESVGAARHSIEPHTTLRDKTTDRFARTIKDELERARTDHRYARLVIVAPPRFLGALHGTFPKPLRDCVVAEVKRNLTALRTSDIRAHLPSRLFADTDTAG